MINTYYNSGNYFSPLTSSNSASMQALRALSVYSDTTYGGDTSPILDVVSLGDPFQTKYDDVNAMRDASRRLQAQRLLGTEAPSNLMTMSTGDFLSYARSQATALNAIRAEYGTKSSSGDKTTTAGSSSSPLQVRGHERFDADGKAIPVVSETVSKAGQYGGTHETTYNPSGMYEADATYGRGQAGGYYNVTTTWADGSTDTRQVQNKGWAIDVY